MAIRDLFHNDIDGVNFDHDLTQVLILSLKIHIYTSYDFLNPESQI